MKQNFLLLFVMTLFITAANAQTDKKQTGYAITGQQKGQTGWREVRLMDITTGDELKTIYKMGQETEILNARTGKAVVKKDIGQDALVSAISPTAPILWERKEPGRDIKVYTIDGDKKLQPVKTEVNVNSDLKTNVNTTTNVTINKNIDIVSKDGNRKVIIIRNGFIQNDGPFSMNSAALAYDKKHDRLYFTPMGFNQLRYIDLKSNKIYFFEDEPFGNVTGFADINNHITRMVFASDGNGYALTNDANHLIQFTTCKKPTITDLGALTDDAANVNTFSVHSRGGFGGDMIADASGNLYLITANRRVYKISLETKVATYIGGIKGLPQGYNTNGAMVEEGSKVIVCSAESTFGYFRFDLTTLQAEKVSAGTEVFNASDLANGNLAFEKTKEEKKEDPKPITEERKPVVTEETIAKPKPGVDIEKGNGITVYPNPVIDGLVKLSFTDQPIGKYQLQLIDIDGQVITSKEIVISSKVQVSEFRIPENAAKGTYLIKVIGIDSRISASIRLIVQ